MMQVNSRSKAAAGPRPSDRTPGCQLRPKRSSEVGGIHLCFEVDDVHASAERLRAMGVEMLEGPNLVEEGPLAGFNWIYFRAPWGLLLEVASFDKLGYEKTTQHRLWRARDSAA